MKIQTVPVTEINPAIYNPRLDLQPGDSDYETLKTSIDEFGYLELLVWNQRTKTLISGHQRFKILLAQGVQEVEVSVVDLPLQKEKQLNLILNKVRGDWDDEKLADVLKELSAIPDFNIEETGFDLAEVSEILDANCPVIEDDFNNATDVTQKPITQKGELIELGSHRILCADVSEEEHLKILFAEEKAHMIHMDPPFGCAYLNSNRPHLDSRPKNSKDWGGIYNDDLNEEEYEIWFQRVLANVTPFLHPGASAYIWNGFAKFYLMHQTLKKLDFHISTVITWAKPSFAISYGDFNQQTEFCLYSFLKNGPHKWYGPTNESNLWQIARDKASERIHPTQKSLAIPARAIRNSTLRGEIVFDGFLGSGSTLISSEKLGRRCFGCEIEPAYVDGIVKRYISLFGREKVSAEIYDRYMAGEQNGK